MRIRIRIEPSEEGLKNKQATQESLMNLLKTLFSKYSVEDFEIVLVLDP